MSLDAYRVLRELSNVSSLVCACESTKINGLRCLSSTKDNSQPEPSGENNTDLLYKTVVKTVDLNTQDQAINL